MKTGNFQGRGNPNRGYWNKPRHESYYDHHEPCERCLGTDHPSTACPFKLSYCHACRRKGHIKPACRNVKQEAGPRPQSSRGKSRGQSVKRSGKGRINLVEAENNDEETDYVCAMNIYSKLIA